MKFNIIHLDKIDSTNSYLKQLAQAGICDQTVVCAQKQTTGKGRWQRYWFSPKGSLYFSILFKKISIQKAQIMQFLVAIAIVQALEKTFPDLSFSLKWPNDIISHNKKIGGILLERINNDLVIGIGLNINIKIFPKKLENKVISILQLTNQKHDLDKLLKKILKQINQVNQFYQKNSLFSIIKLYKKYWNQKDKKIKIKQGNNTIFGIAKEINKNGYLILETISQKRIIIQQGETDFVIS